MRAATLVGMMALFCNAAAGGEAKRLSPAEKMAAALLESRNCEVNPDNGYTQCHYEYRGLRFTRRILPKTKVPFVDIESVTQGGAFVSFTGTGPCILIQELTDAPEGVAFVFFNVKTGKIHVVANAVPTECLPRIHNG